MHRGQPLAAALITIGCWLSMSACVLAQVRREQKISQTEGGFAGALSDEGFFGRSVAAMGDLNEDGIGDIAVGERYDDDGGDGRGAVWILYLNVDGTVKDYLKISDTAGGFGGVLDDQDGFGVGVAALGDVDDDGLGDLAVGAFLDDDGGTPPSANRGAVWILFLADDEGVKDFQKISSTEGGFGGQIDDLDEFGGSVAELGDLDGDAIPDVAIAAAHNADGGPDRGALWVVFLNADGTVKAEQKISSTQGGFTGQIEDGDRFAGALSAAGDLDGDGLGDLAVGALRDDDGGNDRGALWLLTMNSNGTVKGHRKISDTQGGFTGGLSNGDLFGGPSAALGDVDCDGIPDLAVGSTRDDDGGSNRGAVWILHLNADETVKSFLKVSQTSGRFGGVLHDDDSFGSVAAIGDLDGDGTGDLAVGAQLDDDGGLDRGAVWILLMHDARSLRAGTVNTGDGSDPADVLRVDGAIGDGCRELPVAAGVVHALSISAPPSFPGKGHYGVWIYGGEPAAGDVTDLRYKIGTGVLFELGLGARCLPINNSEVPGSCPCPPVLPSPFDGRGVTSRQLGQAKAALLCLNKKPGFPKYPTTFSVILPTGTWTAGGLIYDTNSINSPALNIGIVNWIVIHAL